MVSPRGSDEGHSHRRYVSGVHMVTWCFLIFKCSNKLPMDLIKRQILIQWVWGGG